MAATKSSVVKKAPSEPVIAKKTPAKAKPKTTVMGKNPDLKPQAIDRGKLKANRTHSGSRAAEIVIRPPLKLTREDTDIAVVAWGRMNPPTKGHERLVKLVSELAEDQGAYPMLFLSPGKQDIKNPLSYNERMYMAEEAFGHLVNVEEASEVTDPIKLLKYVSERFDKVVVVTGAEHQADYERFFEDYNGIEFTFESTELFIVDRDQTSTELDESISATQMREYAITGNVEKFTLGLPEALQEQSQYVMDCVRFGQALLEAKKTNVMVNAIIDYRNNNV